MKTWAVSLVIIVLLAFQTAYAAAPAWVIRPCQGVGYLAIGTDGAWLVRVWGPPREAGLWAVFDNEGLAVRGVYRQYISGVDQWVGSVAAVAVVAQKWPYETDHGIRLGSAVGDVVKAYGNTRVVRLEQGAVEYLANQHAIVLEYRSECSAPETPGGWQTRTWKGGIRFVLDGPPQQEKVTTIIVF